MGADAEDISLTIHPHPMLSETFGLPPEMITGTITIFISKNSGCWLMAAVLLSGFSPEDTKSTKFLPMYQ